MSNLFLSFSLVCSVGLVTLILLQAKGTGLSAVFGGDGGVYRSRRGVEKILHRATVGLAAVFMVLAVANILLVK
jgi:preprotein translocase subunit SecG